MYLNLLHFLYLHLKLPLLPPRLLPWLSSFRICIFLQCCEWTAIPHTLPRDTQPPSRPPPTPPPTRGSFVCCSGNHNNGPLACHKEPVVETIKLKLSDRLHCVWARGGERYDFSLDQLPGQPLLPRPLNDPYFRGPLHVIHLGVTDGRRNKKKRPPLKRRRWDLQCWTGKGRGRDLQITQIESDAHYHPTNEPTSHPPTLCPVDPPVD